MTFGEPYGALLIRHWRIADSQSKLGEGIFKEDSDAEIDAKT